jgi:hypothetical protein
MQEERRFGHLSVCRTLQRRDQMPFGLQHCDRAFGAARDCLEPCEDITGELRVCWINMQVEMARQFDPPPGRYRAAIVQPKGRTPLRFLVG